MPNYNSLIFTGADFKFFLALANGVSVPLLTLDTATLDVQAEEEVIFAIGEEDAIGNKQNSRKYSGKLSLQLGELNALLSSQGILNATFITGATLAVTAIIGGYATTFRNVNFNGQTTEMKRKDKETLANLTFTCLTQAA